MYLIGVLDSSLLAVLAGGCPLATIWVDQLLAAQARTSVGNASPK